MNYYITNFGNLKNLKDFQIPISTAIWQPKFWKYGLDRHNVFLGITEPLLSPAKLNSADLCIKNCPYKSSVPNCPFLVNYAKYLDTIDFDYLLSEFERVANDVRKINNFIGEPDIVLLVYEAENNPCSERAALKSLFKKHNIVLKEFNKNSNNDR